MARIVFFGTPDYVLPALDSLKKDHELVAVVTQPAKPVGRKKEITLSPVAEWAKKEDVQVFDRAPKELVEPLKKTGAEVGILAAYGKILPAEILNIFPKGILNLHPSLLPKYRGASPVAAAIAAGERETGVTIIIVDEEVDHGAIVAQFSEEIAATDTRGSLRERLFRKSADVLAAILPAYLEGRIEPRRQDHAKATFTEQLTREDGKIDWKKKTEEIERFVRAMTPWPGAWTFIQITNNKSQITKKRLKILKSHLEEGKLMLDKVQLEGKNPVSWEQFKQGYPEAEIIRQ